MRWEELFADLAAQGDAMAREARRDEIAERYRIEIGSIDLRSRLVAARSKRVAVQTVLGRMITGRLDRVGGDWLLITDEFGREVVVSLDAVQAVRGIGRGPSNANTAAIDVRLEMRSVLRAISRDRSTVVLELADGSTLTGLIDRVAADHVELNSYRLGERGTGPMARDAAVVARAHVISITRNAE